METEILKNFTEGAWFQEWRSCVGFRYSEGWLCTGPLPQVELLTSFVVVIQKMKKSSAFGRSVLFITSFNFPHLSVTSQTACRNSDLLTGSFSQPYCLV
jgi:hypothetical protein